MEGSFFLIEEFLMWREFGEDEFSGFMLFGLNYFLHLGIEIIAMCRYLFLIKIDVKILNRV